MLLQFLPLVFPKPNPKDVGCRVQDLGLSASLPGHGQSVSERLGAQSTELHFLIQRTQTLTEGPTDEVHMQRQDHRMPWIRVY